MYVLFLNIWDPWIMVTMVVMVIKTDKSDRTDISDIYRHLNLTFLVNCVGQLSQFLRCFLQISFLQHIQGNLLLGKLTTTYKPTGHGTSIINNGQIIHVFIVRPTLVQTRILTLLQIFPWQSYVKSRPDE